MSDYQVMCVILNMHVLVILQVGLQVGTLITKVVRIRNLHRLSTPCIGYIALRISKYLHM